ASTTAAALGLAAAYAVAGVADVVLLSTYERGLRRIVSQSTFDLLHFSLHPVNAARLALTCGLVLMHAAVIWMGAAFVLAPEMRWRTINTWPWKALKTAGWLVGASVMMAAASPAAAAIPVSPMWVALAVTGAFAATVRRVSGRLRRASQAARLVIGF